MFYFGTNIGPEAAWKVEKMREQFPDLPLVYRDYPMTKLEYDYPGYDEGAAIMNDLHSIGFTRELTDQEAFAFWTAWLDMRKS